MSDKRYVQVLRFGALSREESVLIDQLRNKLLAEDPPRTLESVALSALLSEAANVGLTMEAAKTLLADPEELARRGDFKAAYEAKLAIEARAKG